MFPSYDLFLTSTVCGTTRIALPESFAQLPSMRLEMMMAEHRRSIDDYYRLVVTVFCGRCDFRPENLVTRKSLGIR